MTSSLISRLKKAFSYLRKEQRLAYLFLFFILLFALTVRVIDINWGIKNHPNFQYSNMEDEAAKINVSLDLDSSDYYRPNQWLMIKGTTYPTVVKISYEIVENSYAANTFKYVYGEDLTTPIGQYYFYRSINIFVSFLLVITLYFATTLLLKNKYAGVLAAFLFSVIFGSTFYSIIFKSDIIATLLVLLVVIVAVLYQKKANGYLILLMGLLVGVAFAVKYNTVFSGVMLAIVLLENSIQSKEIQFKHGAIALLGILIGIFVAGPHIFFEHELFYEGIEIQKEYQTSRSFHFQEFGFQPFAIFRHVLWASLGPVITILSTISIANITYKLVTKYKKYRLFLPMFVYMLVYFISISTNTWIVTRYTIPLYPVLIIFICVLVIDVNKYIKKYSKGIKIFFLTIFGVCLLFQLVWFLAFNNLIASTNNNVKVANYLSDDSTNAPILDLAVQSGNRSIYGYNNPNKKTLRMADIKNEVAAGKKINRFNVKYILLSERTYRQFYRLESPEYRAYRKYFDPLFESDSYKIVKKYETPAEFLGIEFNKGFLPQDLIIANPDVYIIENTNYQDNLN